MSPPELTRAQLARLTPFQRRCLEHATDLRARVDAGQKSMTVGATRLRTPAQIIARAELFEHAAIKGQLRWGTATQMASPTDPPLPPAPVVPPPITPRVE